MGGEGPEAGALKKDSPTPLPTRGLGEDLGGYDDLETAKIQLLFGSPLAGKCELSVFYYSALITSACSLLEAVPFPRKPVLLLLPRSLP